MGLIERLAGSPRITAGERDIELRSLGLFIPKSYFNISEGLSNVQVG